MVAEKTSNTEQMPELLRTRAVILSGEMAWPAEDALRVIEWLSGHGFAVAGVELWRDAGSVPRWLGSGACSSESPSECAREALNFIREFEAFEPAHDNFYNLTW